MHVGMHQAGHSCFVCLQTLRKKERPQRENIAKRSYAEAKEEDAELEEIEKKKKSKIKFQVGQRVRVDLLDL